EPELSTVFGHVLRRYPVLLLTAIVAFLVLIVAAAIAGALLSVSILLLPLFILATLAAIVGLVVWWLKPSTRTAWLKWLIILATPFGLFMYLGGLLSLSLLATVLEPRGPFSALRRSAELVDRHWFRAIAILFVADMIVVVLQY